MKKKWLVMGAGVGIGTVMLAVGGLSAMAGTSGYEAWKSALKQTKTAESLAGSVTVSVTDNGAKLIGADADFKKGEAGASASVKLNAGSAVQTLNAYLQDGKAILKTGESDVYRVVDHGEAGPNWHHGSGEGHQADPEMAAKVERVMDALVGNLKDRVTLKEQPDGSKQVSLHLSGNEVPVAVNAIGSLLLGHASDEEMPGHGIHTAADAGEANGHPGAHQLFDAGLKPNLPKLTDDIQVEEIKLDASIGADRYFDSESVKIRFSGKDEAGTAHSVVVQADIDLSGINATKPDTVDLTGKQVETIDPSEDMPHGRWK